MASRRSRSLLTSAPQMLLNGHQLPSAEKHRINNNNNNNINNNIVEKHKIVAEAVQLDVGGQLFKTSAETLAQCDYFKMNAGKWKDRLDHHGSIFLDRDPEMFTLVLSYLRGNRSLPADQSLLDRLLTEAEYFGIHSLIMDIKRDTEQIELIFKCEDQNGDYPEIGRRKLTRRSVESLKRSGFSKLLANSSAQKRKNKTAIYVYGDDIDAWFGLLDVFLFEGAAKLIGDWEPRHDRALELALENGIEVAVNRLADQFDRIADERVKRFNCSSI